MIAVGYEINKKKKYPVKVMDGIVIGGYGVTFDQRCSFIYLSGTFTRGYFIRKQNWKVLLSDHPDISKCMKRNLIIDYFINIRCKIMVSKRQDI